MKGIVMAGGRALRFRRSVEKSTLTVNGRSLLVRSVTALRNDHLDDVLIATTDAHPDTIEAASVMGINVVITSGSGYHEDIQELIVRYGRFVSLNVDVPFIAPTHVDKIIGYRSVGSVAAVVPTELSMTPVDSESSLVDSEGRQMVWIGLNVVSSDPHTALLEFGDPLLTVNVNDDRELAFADFTARQRGL